MYPAARWKASNYGELLIEQWDEEVFLFNPASGHTHVLNPAAAALLAEIAEHPTDVGTLCRRFQADDPAPDPDAFADSMVHHIQQLALIGLIEVAA